MPTKNLVQQQREIIQRSYSLVNDYNQKKAEADARLSREKEAAQAVASVNPENSLAAIRQAVKSAQDAISKSKLLNKVGKGVSSFSMQNINGLDFAQQIAQCQTEAERASKRIPSIQAMEFERKETGRKLLYQN